MITFSGKYCCLVLGCVLRGSFFDGKANLTLGISLSFYYIFPRTEKHTQSNRDKGALVEYGVKALYRQNHNKCDLRGHIERKVKTEAKP